MNIYKSLNELTEYIELHLEDEIDYSILAKILAVNVYTMQRLFSLITGVSIAEYIRKRRLSNAGFDLYNGNIKVIDVAIKYGYDNATSFSRAFANFHGIKPSLVTKETKLKNFPRITFNEDIDKVEEVDYEIVELDNLELYGLSIDTNNASIGKDAPMFFKEFSNKYEKIYGEVNYGMISYDTTRDNCTKYYCLYNKEIKNFEKIVIPKSRWLKFKISSQNAKDIQAASHKFYLNFLPSCKYNLKEYGELEYYHDGITDFLIAIY